MNWNNKISSKICTVSQFKSAKLNWDKKSKIVFTNGCFDLLHNGHLCYLMDAASLGDKLIIGLNSDASVKRLKGENRPIKNENERALQLASLAFVDAVILFEEDTPLELIKSIMPNLLVKGGDYSVGAIVGAEEVTKNGGEVKLIPFIKGYSSTNLIDQIKSLQ
jgi:rfaE bifunctional protein nucleotidyltransferase chain/domain